MSDTDVDRKPMSFVLLLAAGLAQFIVCADYFAIAIALPPMADDLGVRAIDLQWVITGYILSFSATLGISGALGDRYGRKKLLLLGIIIFAVVSVWVGLGRSATEVVVARIVLGLGGGLIFPLGTAVVSHASTARGLARNIALLTGVATIGTAVGPVLGGVLTETLGWRWIFFANVPICAIAFVMVSLFARESRDPGATGRLDFVGILLLVTGIGAFSVGIDRIPHWSLQAWGGMTAGGAALLVIFVLFEARIKMPIIDVRLFRNREFLGFSATGMLANSAWCVLVLLGTLQLQKILGETVLEAAWVFLFLSGSVATASFLAPALERRLGTVLLVRIALLLQTIGVGILYFMDSAPWLAAGMFIAGFGCSWGWAMPQAGAIRTIPREKAGLASGSVLTLMIMAGNTAFVAAAMVIDLYPDDVAGEARGIRMAFLCNALMALLGLVIAVLFLKRLSREDRDRLASVTERDPV
jgi:MFS family permease